MVLTTRGLQPRCASACGASIVYLREQRNIAHIHTLRGKRIQREWLRVSKLGLIFNFGPFILHSRLFTLCFSHAAKRGGVQTAEGKSLTCHIKTQIKRTAWHRFHCGRCDWRLAMFWHHFAKKASLRFPAQKCVMKSGYFSPLSMYSAGNVKEFCVFTQQETC